MPALLLLWGGRSGGRLIIIVLENTPFLRDCCLFLAPFPPNWLKTIWIFLITSLHTAALSLPSPREICKSRTETEADTFLFPFSVHEFEAVLLLCTLQEQKTQSSPILSLCSDPKQWRKRERKKKHPVKRRRENINKNIKRRHLLCDCCVHLYTSLHHYGLFSLQIKPEIVQITRRLKSF